MKLFFDARYIRTDYPDGISRYTAELGYALAARTPVTFIISHQAQLQFLPKDAAHIIIHSVTSPKEAFTALILNKYQPDIVVSPLQTMGSFGRKFKLILTLHDLIYYKHRTPPPQFNPAVRLGWRLYHATYIPGRIALNSADVVATVSQTSKQEIVAARLTKCPVIVVPNAPQNLGRFLNKEIVQQKNAPQNLIYMGAFIPYKNVETLIDMMNFLPGRTLHLCSRISPSRKAQLQRRVGPSAKVVFHDGVSDEEYAELLAGDAMMVSASKAEGYGLPLAEALEIGTPAVVSDMPIFLEVAGEGALYADPENASDFAKKIIHLDDQKARQELVRAGKQHIAQYDWQESAKTLLESCQELFEQS